jgi:hypothetical protein
MKDCDLKETQKRNFPPVQRKQPSACSIQFNSPRCPFRPVSVARTSSMLRNAPLRLAVRKVGDNKPRPVRRLWVANLVANLPYNGIRGDFSTLFGWPGIGHQSR